MLAVTAPRLWPYRTTPSYRTSGSARTASTAVRTASWLTGPQKSGGPSLRPYPGWETAATT
jgi:hypothetical protein